MRYGLTLALMVTLAGCEQAMESARVPASESGYNSSDDVKSSSPLDGVGSGGAGSGGMLSDDTISMISTVAAGDLDDAAVVQRKIIYNATLSVVVENFDGIDERITQLITTANGYKSSVNIDSNTGKRRRGTWVARVPIESYNQFLDDISDMGVPESVRQSTDDVTTRFIDVEARLKSKQELETRLGVLVAEREGNISDVMEAERELARVRGEIESLEGELRYLANQSALSTVTINIREDQGYEPPQAPSFGGRIAHTWSSSLLSLQKTGQALLIAVVGFAPWLAVMFIVLLPFGMLWRGRRKRKASRTA